VVLPGCTFRIFSGMGFWVLAQRYVADLTSNLMCMSRWDAVDQFDTNHHHDLGISSQSEHQLNIINTNSVIASPYLAVQDSLYLVLTPLFNYGM
jgi:hypothetical protein